MPSFEYYKWIINRQERFNIGSFRKNILLTVVEDKNSILTRKRCCHLSDPVLSVRPGSKYPNTRRALAAGVYTLTAMIVFYNYNVRD
jgi:hypothetical protein